MLHNVFVYAHNCLLKEFVNKKEDLYMNGNQLELF